jgi:hypothetical protein
MCGSLRVFPASVRLPTVEHGNCSSSKRLNGCPFQDEGEPFAGVDNIRIYFGEHFVNHPGGCLGLRLAHWRR